MKRWHLILVLLVVGVVTYFGCNSNAVPTAPLPSLIRFVSADVCVGCHIEKGDEWSLTKHSRAFDDLMASASAADYCKACHVTGLDDNSGNSGYDDPDPAVAAKFEGVQCEKCHGAGGDHIQTFEPLGKPLGAWLCGECHDGSHHSTYTEWQTSKHAVALDARDLSSHFGVECLQCHSADYRFADSVPEDATVWDFDFGITCVVCHDPHSTERPFQLRAEPKELCGECHTGEGAVPGQTPHHTTVDMLKGEAGYEYPGQTYNDSYHTSIEEACVACHMWTAPFVDDANPTVSGHEFTPKIQACQECHAGLDTFDRDGKQTEIEGLMEELKAKLDVATDDEKLTLSYERAKFNYDFCNSEGSHGIHNFKYAKKLLEDSIDDFNPGGPPPEAAYVGSATCNTCHSGIYDTWIESAHPYKLNKVVGGVPPTYPFSSVPDAPSITTWADVTYVIGGYGWKARFLGSDGYIVTGQAGDGVQYNLATLGWVEYKPGTLKPYDCGKCHTTGWQTLAENGGVHQDGLPGISGTWEETGITCEACHGPGSNHVAAPSTSNIEKDSSASLCGKCHTRDASNRILVHSNNLVDHHEQYDEYLHSPHGGVIDCVTCHDPHAGVKYDSLAAGTGVTKLCTDCHSPATHTVSGSMASLDCLDCHMPDATQSAITTGTGLHLKGDVANHIWAIDTTGIALDGGYFETDGTDTWIKEDVDGQVKLNLAWSCMQCHNGTDAFEMTSYSMAAAKADGIHG